MGKLALAVASAVVVGTVSFVSGRVFGPPIVAQWGPELKRTATGLLQRVDALTWETWQWVLAGAAGLYILTAAGVLVSQVKRRGPEGLSNALVLANVPGALVVGHLVAVAVVLTVVGFSLYGCFLLLRAGARQLVEGAAASWRDLQMWREDRRRWRRRASQPRVYRGGQRSRMQVGEFSGLDGDLPTGAPWPRKAT